MESDNFAALMQINLDDLLDNLGLKRWAFARSAFARLFHRPVAAFTQLVVDYDRRVGEAGLQTASREIMQTMVREVRVAGIANIPREGPVLFAANHAGVTETLVCFSAIPRTDLKAVGNDRPFVRLLPHVFEQLVPVPEQTGDRFAAVRQAARHLQVGGALFMNPAGHIEPDPACMAGAIESLRNWSPSVALLIKRAPHTAIVPTLVSGVIMPSTLTHPFARLRRTQRDRERAAASIQLMIHLRRRGDTPLTPTVEFGHALLASDLARLGEAAAIVGTITDQMANMMRAKFKTTGAE